MSQPLTYHRDHFYRALLRGIRFVWPLYLADAVEERKDIPGYRFSAEMSMRVRNIRSFALTKDFLDVWQEFRGEAPQLEPSLTLYRCRNSSSWDTMHRLEELYWQQMRQRHQSHFLPDQPAPP